ncbi:MAG: hypothetical protein ACR2FY_00810 [Pirellulaceae bacterium]
MDRLIEDDTGLLDEWESVPEDEMLWTDEELRWRAEIPASIYDEVMTVVWLKRPHEDPTAGWTMFASGSRTDEVVANPGLGYFDIKFMLLYDIVSFVAAAPKERQVDQIAGVQWEKGDDKQRFLAPDAQHPAFGVFPEADKPLQVKPGDVENATLVTQDRTISNKVNVVVTLAMVPKIKDATIYLGLADPDHRYNPLGIDRKDTLDPNDIGPDPNDTVIKNKTRPRDNRLGGVNGDTPAASNIDIGGSLDKIQLVFKKDVDITKTSVLTIAAPQPGNNYIVAATDKKNVATVSFDTDGVSVVETIQKRAKVRADPTRLPPNRVSSILEVWRTLHIESDSMAAPNAKTDGPFGMEQPQPNDPNPGNIPKVDPSDIIVVSGGGLNAASRGQN